jgi:hypothetical protein
MCEIVFTRYLYNKELVLQSLEKTIIEGLYDESLFWGYELYFSGFESEVFNKCFGVFNTYYYNYKKLGKFFLKKKKEWNSSNEGLKDEILAILIKNMCMRKRDLNKEEPKREMYVIVDSTQVDCFRTRSIKPAWKTLPLLCKYDLRVSNETLHENEMAKRLEILREDWLFYASYSPVWKTRILENRGQMNIAEKKVSFKNDDCLEVFYENYGFEPDEQSLELQNRCLGIKY